MNTKELGDLGERIACEYLVKKGFKIVGKNYMISFGEIDIIAKKRWRLFKNDKTIHFIEVKTIIGNNNSFFPEERVDYKKQRKLKNLAQIWMEKNNLSENCPYQIDIIGISVNEITRNAKLHYFPNAVGEI